MAERVDDAELSMNQLEALKDMAIDNIRKQAQVVSQVFTGKCRYCKEPRPARRKLRAFRAGFHF
ncbi:hypothetical protein [Escherichia coli]|uniref:hypothetical protein n=1 Tax=Escherichia coli TaxID=562 RepID=UPI003BA22F1D